MKIIYVALVAIVTLISVGAVPAGSAFAGPCDPNVQRC